MIAKIALITLSILAVHCIIILQVRNGFFDLLAEAGSSKPLKLPGSSENGITKITGLAPLDSHLVQLLMFFWPAVSAKLPSLSLFAFYMTGQVLVLHVLVLLEGLRIGNLGNIISYSTFWGVLYQTVPWGIVMPVYFAVHLWTSKTVQLSNSKELSSKLAIDTRQLKMLPISVLLGFIIPTFLAGAPSPFLTTVTQQQFFLIFWQGFPIWIGICQYILTTIFSALPPSTDKKLLTSKLFSLRGVYVSALSLTGLIHATTFVFARIPPLRPSFFTPRNNPEISLESVFLPMSPFSATKVSTIDQGCLILLQYDMYFACGAALLWALVIRSRIDNADLGWKTLVRTLLFGPGGAALVLVWERDEMVFGSKDQMSGKGEKSI